MRLASLISGLVLAVCLAGCVPSDEGSDVILGPGAAASDPSNAAIQQAACERRGGEWRTVGLGGLMTCFTTPKDAGKYCTKSTECSTECLARSRSCAPIQPLYGCNDLLDAQGRTVTQCVD
ncbi:MAG: hypothetical protein ABF243_02630 [Celeribacter marinus]